MVTQLRQVNAPYRLLITSLEPIPIMMVNNLLCIRLIVLSIYSMYRKKKSKHTENEAPLVGAQSGLHIYQSEKC